MWYDNNGSYNGTPMYQCVRCPVCKTYLGRKDVDDSVAFHCEECSAVYTFFPGVEKPTARLDQDIAETCKCPSCKANRGEFEEEEEYKPITYPSRSDD